MTIKHEIEREALGLGFSAFGVSDAAYDPRGHTKFLNWLSRGFQAEMKYLERGPRPRFDPKIHLPSARSVIVCAHNYYIDPDIHPGQPYISIYARGQDYHRVLGDKLASLGQKIRGLAGDVALKTFVDSGAISEKSFAVRAGLGFIGRNGLLIMPPKKGNKGGPRGSFHFLGIIITDLFLEPDLPASGTCGKCRMCIEACPTGAIVSDGEIDARRCISYQTTQSKDDIHDEIAAVMGDIVYGCDICQQVCPYNSSSIQTSEPRFQPAPQWTDPDIQSLLNMSEEEYRSRFKNSVMGELKYYLFRRNLVSFLKRQKDG